MKGSACYLLTSDQFYKVLTTVFLFFLFFSLEGKGTKIIGGLGDENRSLVYAL